MCLEVTLSHGILKGLSLLAHSLVLHGDVGILLGALILLGLVGKLSRVVSHLSDELSLLSL